MTRRSLPTGLAVLALGVLIGLGACAVTGVGVGYDGGPDYVGGFYEPYGYEYGGWGGGYRVGPPRGGYRGGGAGGPGRPGGHPYHSAPSGRSMPSMPGRPRGR